MSKLGKGLGGHKRVERGKTEEGSVITGKGMERSGSAGSHCRVGRNPYRVSRKRWGNVFWKRLQKKKNDC